MTHRPVSEATLTPTDSGMKPEGDGWFVVNVADAMAMGIGETQYGFIFEGGLRTFPHFYCPPGTAHVIVGAGDRPCAVLMVGARTAAGDVFYPASAAAARHGASVADDTSDRAKAYAGSNPIQPGRYAWPPA